ncbi:hypothetical protein IAT38_000866 [Cryptococcus sp. DSM 104549]
MPALAAGTYLHYLTPVLLALPLPALLRPLPTPFPELPGIRPITVQRITPRRSLILTLLILLAFTSFLDGAVLVADALSARTRYGDDLPRRLRGAQLAAEIFYALGGLSVWGVAVVGCAWRGRFAGKGLVVLGTLAVVCEVPNLVFLVLREIHAGGLDKVFAILSLVPSSARLLLLPILLVAVSYPRISFEPADETTGLLSSEAATTGGGGGAGGDARTLITAPSTSDYGTFDTDSIADPTKTAAATPHPGNTTGAATPTQGAATGEAATAQAQAEQTNQQVKKIKLTKKLGSKRPVKKILSWGEGWPKFKKLFPKLWPSTSRKLQAYVVIVMGFIGLERVTTPLVPISLGYLVKALSDWSKPADVWKALALYLGARLIDQWGILSLCRQYFWIPVVQYTDKEMQMLCFNHILDLSLAYHTRRNTGEVLRIIDRGSAINELFRTVLFQLIPTIADTFIGFTVFIWLFGPFITFSILLVMVPYCLFSFYSTRYSQKYRREYIDTDVRQRGIVSDVLTNWESVKYFTSEAREVERFEEAVNEVQGVDYLWRMGLQVIYCIQSFLLVLAFAVGAILLSIKVMHGAAHPSTFVVYIAYFSQFTSPLNQLSSLYKGISSDIIDAEKMLDLLGEKTEIKDDPDAKEMVITDGVIEFDNVTFSYDESKEAIKNVSFKLEKGQSLALVGETGSGKSTILRLLYRFYDVSSGHIYIDGQDISKVTQASLRRAIGIVPQDSVLWNDTIGANIAYGKPEASDEEIIEAAKAGRIHDKIMTFEDEYDTFVGERGVRLSGGEKQRVSLARMFLKSPAILVLDEATSALDTETEREIQKSLAALSKGRTSLSIAHRLSTIINSDKIMVMKAGKLVEIGGYNELIQKKGAFARMWHRQIYTEAEALEGDSLEKFANALPTADDFKQLHQKVEDGDTASEAGSSQPRDGPGGGDVAEADAATVAPAVASEQGSSTQAEGGSPLKEEVKDETKDETKEEAEQTKEEAEQTKGFEVDAPSAIAEDPAAASFADVVKTEEDGQKDAPAESAAKEDAGDAQEAKPVSYAAAVSDAAAPAPAPESKQLELAPEASSSGKQEKKVEDEDKLVDLSKEPTPAEAAAAEAGESSAPALATVPAPSPAPSTPKASVVFPPAPPPSGPVPFPGNSQRHSTISISPSVRSNLSAPGTPSRDSPSPTKSDAISGTSGKTEKGRKRLSSGFGKFVRRISDQSGGLVRSASGLRSPAAEGRERTMSMGWEGAREDTEAGETTGLLAGAEAVQGSSSGATQAGQEAPISTSDGMSSGKEKKKKKKKNGKH